MHKALFLDRDGTLIEHVPYFTSLGAIKLNEPIVEFAVAAQTAGYRIIVVSNQSGVARGYFDEQFVQQANDYIASLLLGQYRLSIDGWYYCPHHPTEAVVNIYLQDCVCRKPKPGMLLTAAADRAIDLNRSIMIGDQPCDAGAGRAAGCQVWLVDDLLALLPTQRVRLLF